MLKCDATSKLTLVSEQVPCFFASANNSLELDPDLQKHNIWKFEADVKTYLLNQKRCPDLAKNLLCHVLSRHIQLVPDMISLQASCSWLNNMVGTCNSF